MATLLTVDFAPVRDQAEREAYESRRVTLDELRDRDNPLVGAEWPGPEYPVGTVALLSFICFTASAFFLWLF